MNDHLVTFINPPVIINRHSLSMNGPCPPIGLAYIVGETQKAGYSINVIDSVGENILSYRPHAIVPEKYLVQGLVPEEIVQRVDPQTKIFGISLQYFEQWPMVRHLCNLLKIAFPQTLIVLGGETATSYCQDILVENSSVDFCVLGEGERVFLNLLKGLPSQTEIRKTPGLAFLGEGGVVQNPRERRMASLDSIPWPAWEFFPISSYHQVNDGFGFNKGKSLPIMGTRGCPYQCTFCSSPEMWTTKYVMREPADVVREMEYFQKKYDVVNFNFCDLTLIANIHWIRDFCRILIDRELKVSWQLPGGSRCEVLKEDVLRLMRQSGFYYLSLAPESGSQILLDKIKKRVDLKKLFKVLKTARLVGLTTRISIILGHPLEMRSDVLRSFLFVYRCAWEGLDDLATFIFTPYPGSEDYKKLRANGKIHQSEENFYITISRSGDLVYSYNPIMGRRELLFYQFLLLATFYIMKFSLRPVRIFWVIMNLLRGGENTQIEKFINRKKSLKWAIFEK